MRWKARKKRGWFAWRPVRIESGEWVWLERVHRYRGFLGAWFYIDLEIKK